MNSQVVYAIPSMQDALFFFFGILGLWSLARFKSIRSLWAVAAYLLLSLLSKETAIVFVIIALLYLFWFNRERLYRFLLITVLPVALYLVLKINAVGLNSPQHGAPIDNLSLAKRLFTAPSLVQFYATKFIFPWRLASGYYWTYSTFSISHVLVPLIIDLAIAGLFIYFGIRIHKKLSKKNYHTYLFFTVWAVIGLVPYMQIIPLDMTACEAWFYFSMAGLLGMIGVISMTIKTNIQPIWFILIATILIIGLGVRTAIRGTDYSSQYILARRDMAVSKGDYSAMNNVAEGLINLGKFKDAASYAQQSANIYPTVSNYDNLGVALQDYGNYSSAVGAYKNALHYGSLSIIYENLDEIYLVHGNPVADDLFFQKALQAYPQDFKLWVYQAILQDAQGYNAKARISISAAIKYGQVPAVLYNDILANQPFALSLPNLGTVVVR